MHCEIDVMKLKQNYTFRMGDHNCLKDKNLNLKKIRTTVITMARISN